MQVFFLANHARKYATGIGKQHTQKKINKTYAHEQKTYEAACYPSRQARSSRHAEEPIIANG
jgi:hypothetical protein